MALPPKIKAGLSRFSGRRLAGLVRLVHRTSRIVSDPADVQQALRDSHPAIIGCWHGQFMMLAAAAPKDRPFAAMVARHGDAELVGRAMEQLGVRLIRGAGAGNRRKDRGGAAAMIAALKALREGTSLVMTADVPPGPARRAGAGIVAIAQKSGCPILPVAAATRRYRAFNTWSRLTVNLPFSTLAYVVGEPIMVPADADEQMLESKRLAVEQALNAVTRKAYRLAGADPVPATPSHAMEPGAPPDRAGVGLRTYRIATAAFSPAAPLFLQWRERAGKEDGRRRGERLGRASLPRPDGQLIWVHAASVGETNAILPLIEGLAAQRPEAAFLLTTGTRTSAHIASERLAGRAIHQFVPLDMPAAARRFLDHWKPDLAVFTESEIWPNLILEASAKGVPLALVNARMSERSFSRWRGRPAVSRPLFSRFAVVLAQNEKLAQMFSRLGARHVEAVGNLKIDAPPPPVDAAAFDALAAAVAGRRGYVAASTHEGEEEIIGQAHKLIAKTYEDFLTILAPRHPERGTAIAEHLRSLGLRVVQRSTQKLPEPATDIYVADTIGELGTLYALAPVAFIGGSLVDKGGQNPIEAVRHGTAVVVGPHTGNFTDAYGSLARHGGIAEVRSAAELAATVSRLVADDEALASQRRSAETALETLSGALDRTIGALLMLLPGGEGLKRAS